MGGKDWTLIKQNMGERVAGEKAKTAEREVERKAENNSQDSGTWGCGVENLPLF